MGNVFDKIDGRPIHWRDHAGTVHLVEGADVHPGVRLLWTKCGKDVPANSAFLPGDTDPAAGCEDCAQLNRTGFPAPPTRYDTARYAK